MYLFWVYSAVVPEALWLAKGTYRSSIHLKRDGGAGGEQMVILNG